MLRVLNLLVPVPLSHKRICKWGERRLNAIPPSPFTVVYLGSVALEVSDELHWRPSDNEFGPLPKESRKKERERTSEWNLLWCLAWWARSHMVFRYAFQATIFSACKLFQRFTVRVLLLLLSFVFNTFLLFVELSYINVWRVEKQCSVWYNQWWRKRTQMIFVFIYKFQRTKTDQSLNSYFKIFMYHRISEDKFHKSDGIFCYDPGNDSCKFRSIVLLWNVRKLVLIFS